MGAVSEENRRKQGGVGAAGGIDLIFFDSIGPHHYHCAPMSDPTALNSLPGSVVPRKLINQAVRLEGVIQPEHLPRLAESVERVLKPAVVSLQFGAEDGPKRVVRGNAATQVLLRCERCLESFEAPLEADIAMAVVWSEEEAAQLPDQLDPWIVPDESADLLAMVEDGLLLALPIVALHPQDEHCPAPAMSYGSEQEGRSADSAIDEQDDNPFKILEQLKNRSERE